MAEELKAVKAVRLEQLISRVLDCSRPFIQGILEKIQKEDEKERKNINAVMSMKFKSPSDALIFSTKDGKKITGLEVNIGKEIDSLEKFAFSIGNLENLRTLIIKSSASIND